MKMVRARLFIVAALGVLVLCGPAWAVEPNLVSHWRFDEGSGTIAYDSAGDNDGTIYGAQWTTGKIDGALSFDGNEDYVEVPSSVSFDSTTATWSLWVKPTGDPGGSGSSPWGTGCIMIRGDSWGTWNGVHISLMPHATYGTIAIQVKANSNPSVLVEDTVFSSPDITYNEWSHIAFVFDSGNYAELYVNGALTVNYTLGNFAFNNQVLRIATSTDPYLYDFNGEVDEVVIHDRALSPEEIQELYLEELSAYERAIICVENAIDKKQAALETVDAALVEEEDAHDALEELLESGDYGDLKKGDMVKAKQKIHSAIQHEEQSADALEKSIEKLYDALTALGWEPEPEPNLPEPIAHWKFDEGSGTTAYDCVGDNDGTVYGATWTAGQVDGALSFDGDGDYVDLGNDNSLKPSLPISFSTWIKLSEVGVNNIILVTDNQATNYYGLWFFVNTNNKIMINFGDGQGVASQAYRRSKLSSSALSADIWYHAVAVVRGAEDMDIYINGTDDEGSYSGSGDSLAYGSGNARIGMQDTGIYFDGSIDEVRIYDRALAAEEIQELYLDGLSGSRG